MTETPDAWYIIVKAAEAREGYEDIESGPADGRNAYRPIGQYDHTHQQQGFTGEGGGDGPTYAEVVAGSSSQQNASRNASTDVPPSYSAVVKGGNSSLMFDN